MRENGDLESEDEPSEPRLDEPPDAGGQDGDSTPIVVGLGASAGGLQALREVLDGIPDDLDAALVVVQHLSPDFETRMDELLANHTAMPIRRVENEMRLEPGTVYLMPPKAEMIVAGGQLLLSEREPEPGVWLPIDAFFRSLAEESGPRGIGIVLSGTGSDGSRGLQAISEAGGLVVVQDPGTARFDGMPRSAIDTGVTDLVLPPDKVGEAVARYAERASRDELPFLGDEPEDGLEGVFEVLQKETGVDFGSYKANTISRRLDRRLLMTGTSDVDQYLELLRRSPAEREALYRDLLIGVTSFFRDREAFEILERDVLPELVRRLDDGQPMRMWVAACATGEEAYSLAIAASEVFRRQGRTPRLRIFATDVHRGSLEVASAGVYGEDALGELDPELRERYFHRDGGQYRVRDELRNQIVFAYHNVLRDAPFTRLDLVTCRNLLIYLTPQAQRKALALFHFGLKTRGALFLGPSESPGALAEEFGPIHRRWKMYRKRREMKLPPELRNLSPVRRPARTHRKSGQESVLDRARDTLLERFAPAALVVGPDHTVLHTSGGANQYLSHREGTPSLQLLDMVKGELKYALAGALKRARDDEARNVIRYDGVPALTGEGPVHLTVTVSRIGGADEPFLVTLERRDRPDAPLPDDPDAPLDELARERIESLEMELRYAKENLQATIEEMEASNEELQATNEELIASNEELHSANEELQSVNEELYTVNAEHQQKISELQQMTNDMEHLFEATDVHTVFLDSELRIRKFTPKMAETFHLIESDRGRSIDSFAHRLEHPRLTRDLREVLAEGVRIEREVADLDRRSYLMRVLPYQPQDEVEGVVFTLIDISGVKRTEQQLEERENQLAAILEHSPVPIYARDPDGRYFMAGKVAREMLSIDDDGYGERSLEQTDRRVLEDGETLEYEETFAQDGEEHTYLSVKFPVRGHDDAIDGVAGISTEITERKRAEQRQREAVRKRDRFLAMLSHELRNPLAAISNAAHLLEEDGERDRKKTASVLRRQTQHIRDLLEDLLDVSRITLDRLEMRKKPVVLPLVIRRTVEAVQGSARSQGVRLELPEEVPEVTLVADPSRLQQMLTNVLMNAVKFTERGKEVRLDLEANESAVTFRVTDEGVGLAPEEAEQIFDLFYQQEQDLDRNYGGLGVGLSLAQTIAYGHGGSITARSEGRGHGATVEIRLPLPTADELAAAEAEVARSSQAPGPPRDGEPLRVVVVEDQQDNRDLLEMLVATRGHTPVGAVDGEEAVRTIREEHPDLALVDIGLPGIDGYEVARRVRAEEDGARQATFLVALTGYGRPEDRDRAHASGFDAHVVKPMSKQELERLLGEAFQRRASS
ncbi:MAG TPA: chemotaxis protein CheB [Sandaracinaceae bacterium LLY-WYZ-13_1]|nr:chemotaxis protein CheB [Sandaracinaceae bacterium LLY-WYZ-13_1]